MTVQRRRRSIRHPIELPVRYRRSRSMAWRDCRIVDLSDQGAGVELYELEPGESVHDRVELEISTVAPGAAGIVLRALIRHRHPLHGNALRVGVEFTPTSADCAQLLQLVIGLHALATDASTDA